MKIRLFKVQNKYSKSSKNKKYIYISYDFDIIFLLRFINQNSELIGYVFVFWVGASYS
jgi:hypothetical protein